MSTFVKTVDQIIENALTLDRYSRGTKRERKFHHDRIKNGKLFVTLITGGRRIFAPSRFVGYSNNDSSHGSQPDRDGRITNARIIEVLGKYDDKDDGGYRKINSEFLLYCARFGIVPSKHHRARRYWIVQTGNEPRRYWVVSPNVRNDERTVGEWRVASVTERAAFMGWKPNDYEHGQIGAKFAGAAKRSVLPNDVILIARRHGGEPQIVGFGVVRGKSVTRLDGFTPPQKFGSLRKLSPFKQWSRPPSGIPLKEILRHTKALIQLHPDRNKTHDKVCRWMERHLGSEKSGGGSKQYGKTERDPASIGTTPNIEIVDQPENHQLDYQVQTIGKVIKARKIETELLKGYVACLKEQDRTLAAAKYGRLRCDGFEKSRRNLIEAKSSPRREHIRMAVGQLLDYAFAGKQKFGELHKAILLPERPSPSIENWLLSLNIRLIWRAKKSYLDNANGQFS